MKVKYLYLKVKHSLNSRHQLVHKCRQANRSSCLAEQAKLVVVDVNNLKNGRKPVKLEKENPAGCTGEGKQSKGN